MNNKFITSSCLRRPEHIPLKDHPELNEKWVQNLIADDPSILGLGDVVLKDKERIRSARGTFHIEPVDLFHHGKVLFALAPRSVVPRAGRLDLLLQDSDTKRRYEVELQLGPTNETHIIQHYTLNPAKICPNNPHD